MQVVKVIIALTDLTRQIVSSKIARDYRMMNYNIVVLTMFSYNNQTFSRLVEVCQHDDSIKTGSILIHDQSATNKIVDPVSRNC